MFNGIIYYELKFVVAFNLIIFNGLIWMIIFLNELINELLNELYLIDYCTNEL